MRLTRPFQYLEVKTAAHLRNPLRSPDFIASSTRLIINLMASTFRGPDQCAQTGACAARGWCTCRVSPTMLRDLARAWVTAKDDLRQTRQWLKPFLLLHGARHTGRADWGPPIDTGLASTLLAVSKPWARPKLPSTARAPTAPPGSCGSKAIKMPPLPFATMPPTQARAVVNCQATRWHRTRSFGARLISWTYLFSKLLLASKPRALRVRWRRFESGRESTTDCERLI